MVEPALVHGIRTGPCAEFIHCEDFARASTPLPEQHAPKDYMDVGAAVAGMGKHLVDARDAVAGYYPTSYCVRHDVASGTYRVTLEGLVYRQAA